MKKWFLIGGGLVIVIIVAALFYVYTSLGSLIRVAVEKYGSEITQANVQLNEADVSVSSGQGALRGLKIGNPKGFRTTTAFQLDEISVAVDVGTITSNPVVVKEIVISAPQVTYELGPEGSNIDALKRNVDNYTKAGSGAEKSAAAEEKPSGPKLVIQNLYIRNGNVNIGSTVSDQTMSTTLPDIHLTNIGKEKNGATPGEIAETIIDALAKGVNAKVASVDTSQVLGEAKKQFGTAGADLEEKGKGAVEGIGKLFGR